MIEYESDPFSQYMMKAFKKKKRECLKLIVLNFIHWYCANLQKSGTLTATVDAQGVKGYKGLLWAAQWLGHHCPCLGTRFHRYCERQLGGIEMEFASGEENRGHDIILNRA